jgi:hypothetical protein
MALHTWGQQLFLHPHVHVVMTAGGMAAGGSWVVARRRCLFPLEPLRILYRETFCAGLLRLAKRGELRLPPGWDLARARQLCRDLRQKRWGIEVCERYEDPTAVLNYLGRYINGGPIGESRLVDLDGESVWFKYKDNRSEGPEGVPTKVMQLSCVEFVRRVLQHVPPTGFHTVRGYGLYRRGAGVTEELRQAARKAVPLSPKVEEALRSRLQDHRPPQPPIPVQCPICGRQVFEKWRPRPGKEKAA